MGSKWKKNRYQRGSLEQCVSPETRFPTRGYLISIPRLKTPTATRIDHRLIPRERKQDPAYSWRENATVVPGSRRHSGDRERRDQAGAAMGNSTHAYGGTRMGKNPETNVLKVGMAHGCRIRHCRQFGDGHHGARNPTLRCRPSPGARRTHHQQLEISCRNKIGNGGMSPVPSWPRISTRAAVSLNSIDGGDQSVIGQHEKRICPRNTIVQGRRKRPEIRSREISQRVKRNVAENVKR